MLLVKDIKIGTKLILKGNHFLGKEKEGFLAREGFKENDVIIVSKIDDNEVESLRMLYINKLSDKEISAKFARPLDIDILENLDADIIE